MNDSSIFEYPESFEFSAGGGGFSLDHERSMYTNAMRLEEERRENEFLSATVTSPG